MPITPSAIGMSIAAAAVFDMKGDVIAPMKPNARMTPTVDRPTPGSESTANAKRRSSPWRTIAWAMMKPPMKRKIVESAKAGKTSSPEATPRRTARTTPRTAVTGIGIASVSQ